MESVDFEVNPSKLKVFNWQPKKDAVLEEAEKFCKVYLGLTNIIFVITGNN